MPRWLFKQFRIFFIFVGINVTKKTHGNQNYRPSPSWTANPSTCSWTERTPVRLHGHRLTADSTRRDSLRRSSRRRPGRFKRSREPLLELPWRSSARPETRSPSWEPPPVRLLWGNYLIGIHFYLYYCVLFSSSSNKWLPQTCTLFNLLLFVTNLNAQILWWHSKTNC